MNPYRFPAPKEPEPKRRRPVSLFALMTAVAICLCVVCIPAIVEICKVDLYRGLQDAMVAMAAIAYVCYSPVTHRRSVRGR